MGNAATIPVLYAAFFLFGAGEVLADSTSVALLPSVVPAEGLARANARLLGTYLIGNQLAGPPFGACLSLALTRSPWVAGATLVAFGAHATVWGVVSVSLRQRLVPERLRGRVNSVYFLFDLGGAALGTLLGGALASLLGITAPFWLGAGVVALLAVAAWRRFTPAPA